MERKERGKKGKGKGFKLKGLGRPGVPSIGRNQEGRSIGRTAIVEIEDDDVILRHHFFLFFFSFCFL